MSSHSRLAFLSLFAAALLVGAAAASAQQSGAIAGQKVVKDGVSVEFLPSIHPMEGEDVELRFWIRAADGTRLDSVRPSAWIDARAEKTDASPDVCRQKIQSFLSGTLRARPQVDLNAYLIVALNAEPSISVIDPILGFGGSRLLTLVTLRSAGADWALTKDQRRLFVAMPLVNQVAAIDTETWKVVQNVDAGFKPSRLAISADDRFFWVANENADAAAPSLTIVDAVTLKVAASLRTGRGPHRIAFAPDQRFAAVTNARDGSVSLIDTATFAKIADVKSGPSPVAIATSALSGALFVADADGGIAAIDASSREIRSHMAGKAGATSIRFAPGGRWGFVTLPAANEVEIIDSSSASIVATIDVGRTPDQITFTDDYAYIRCAGADEVTMIRLASLGAGQKPTLATFPAGQLPPSKAEVESGADAITAPPEPGSVLVANPADRLIYYYTEGMAAPMGNYQTYGRTPMATLVVDRSLRETAPGVFSIKTRVPAAGMYDVAFFLDSPRVVHCFNLAVRTNPELKRIVAERAVKVEPLVASNVVRTGEPFEMKFRLTNPTTGQVHAGLKDVRILTMLAPGVWQKRELAEPAGDGVYRITQKVPQPGIYYVFLECPSLGLRLNELRPVILEADERKETP